MDEVKFEKDVFLRIGKQGYSKMLDILSNGTYITRL